MLSYTLFPVLQQIRITYWTLRNSYNLTQFRSNSLKDVGIVIQGYGLLKILPGDSNLSDVLVTFKDNWSH